MRICFFLGSNIRSGANLSLLHHAAFCAAQGNDVTIIFQYRFFDKTIDFLKGAADLRTLYLDEYPPGAPLQDVLITNWWQCAFDMHKLPARQYGFYRQGNEKALYESRVFDGLINSVFREDFLWLCDSPILAPELVAVGHQPRYLPNGVDVAQFAAASPALPPKTRRLRVLVEGPISAALKRVDATIAAIRPLPDIEIVHMAADDSRPGMAIDHALGAVAHDAIAGIYASCDLIIKLSALESFAMPVLEQFAAGGTAIVTGFAGHDQYIDDTNAVIVDIDQPFEAAAAALRMLRDDPPLLARLRAAAQATARRFDWQALHRIFLDALADALATRPQAPQALPVIERYAACHQDIFNLWAAEEGRKRQAAGPPAPGKGLPGRLSFWQWHLPRRRKNRQG